MFNNSKMVRKYKMSTKKKSNIKNEIADNVTNELHGDKEEELKNSNKKKKNSVKDTNKVENNASGILPKNLNVTYESILQYRFPLKLYLVANLENLLSVIWNEDGTAILIDLDGLQYYLLSEESIFSIKTRKVFINHLTDHGFKFVDKIILNGITHDIYEHEFFKRGKANLLPKIIYKRYIEKFEFSSNDSIQKCEKSKSRFHQKLQEIEEQIQDPCKKRLFYLSDETKSMVSIGAYGAYNRDKTAIEFAIQSAKFELKNLGVERKRRKATTAISANTEPNFPEGIRVDPTECESFLINNSQRKSQGFYGEIVDEKALEIFFEEQKELENNKTIEEIMEIGDDN